jgi:diketogulonate reductase-like aldo/keto reductase
VALRWTMQQPFSSIPIAGATRLSQLQENLKVTGISLSDAHLQRLNDASAIELGFPGEFYQEEGVRLANYGGFYDRIEKR